MRSALILLLVLTACGREHLSMTVGGVELETASLDFGTVSLGSARTLQLSLRNTSLSPQTGHVSAPAPFALDSDVTLPGGSSVGVNVSFAPTALGPADAQLNFSVGGDMTSLALSGVGQPAPICNAPIDCRTCDGAVQPDGTSCTSSNVCLAPGICFAGSCRGQPISCDDGNACTLDVCDPVSGCSHVVEGAAQCPAPSDPCRVPFCDPTTGCSSAVAADGASCGISDCVTAHICMSGACKVLPVPEGAACGSSSPCQSPGACHAGVCQQTAPGTLTESWRYTPAPSVTSFAFEGVSDALGNLYWVECTETRIGPNVPVFACDLVSFTAAGTSRYRTPITTSFGGLPVRQLLAGGLFIVAFVTGAVVAADASTGMTAWVLDTDLATFDPGTLAEGIHAVVADDAHVFLEMNFENPGPVQSAIYVLDTATGVLTLSDPISAVDEGLVLDATDTLYTSTMDTSSNVLVSSLISLDSTGTENWSHVFDDGFPLAELGGELVTVSGAVHDTAQCSAVAAAPAGSSPMPNGPVLMSSTTRWQVSANNSCVWCEACQCDAGVSVIALNAFAAGSSTQLFSTQVSSFVRPGNPTLLSDSSVLLMSQLSSDPGPMLRAIDTQGQQVFACALLPPPGVNPSGEGVLFGTASALVQGRWAVVHQDVCDSCAVAPQSWLQVFATPGLEEAASGWTGVNGGPSRAGHAH